jgi:hypothetical protein
MILRLWRGWTTAANADAYEELIRSTIFPDILDRGIDGLFRLDLYRRAGEVETEFMTLMWFTDHEAKSEGRGFDSHRAQKIGAFRSGSAPNHRALRESRLFAYSR